MRKNAIMLCFAALIYLGLVDSSFSQTPFYQGKTITVVQIVGAGGTGDLRRRALFPYLQKYIPGNPTIISDYMPGGGGRKAANYVYRNARPDGLTIGGMSASLVTNAILDTAGVQYDIDKFVYLGSPVSVFHYIFLTRKEAGLNSLEKLRSAPEVRIGGQEVGHDVYITGRLFAYLLAFERPKIRPRLRRAGDGHCAHTWRDRCESNHPGNTRSAKRRLDREGTGRSPHNRGNP